MPLKCKLTTEQRPAELASSECLAEAREGMFGMMVSGHLNWMLKKKGGRAYVMQVKVVRRNSLE